SASQERGVGRFRSVRKQWTIPKMAAALRTSGVVSRQYLERRARDAPVTTSVWGQDTPSRRASAPISAAQARRPTRLARPSACDSGEPDRTNSDATAG